MDCISDIIFHNFTEIYILVDCILLFVYNEYKKIKLFMKIDQYDHNVGKEMV